MRSTQSGTGRPEKPVEREDSTELVVYDLPVVAEDDENKQFWMDAILGHRQITQGCHKGDYEYVVRWYGVEGPDAASWEPESNLLEKEGGGPNPILKHYRVRSAG